MRFLSQSPAAIIGRIDSANVFEDEKARWPAGYVLRVRPDGGWELLSTAFRKATITLASGTTALNVNQWHHLELSFHGNQIVVSLDDKPLTTVESSAHTHGMFALGTEWDHIQFDNLDVTR